MTFTNDEAKKLMADIKENNRKLNNCAKHTFGDVVGEGVLASAPGQRQRLCRNCGGKMDDIKVVLYVKGYKAAGGDPDDVARYFDGSSI